MEAGRGGRNSDMECPHWGGEPQWQTDTSVASVSLSLEGLPGLAVILPLSCLKDHTCL